MATGPQPLSQLPEPKNGWLQNLKSRALVLLHRVTWKHAAIALLLAALPVVFWLQFAGQNSSLKIEGQHSFRQAELSVWIDGALAKKISISGVAKRRFGVLQTVQGSFFTNLSLPAGEHTVGIEISSPADGYDRSSELHADFAAKAAHTLFVSAEKRGGPYLSWRDAVPVSKAGASPMPEYAKMLMSLFLTIGGSMLSATIGFLVQERLKNFKAKRAKPE